MPAPLGIYAKAHIDAIELFEAMQAEAMMFIKETFAFEDDSFKLEGASWDKLFQEMERAEREGRMSEFEAAIAQAFGPAWEQIQGMNNGG